MIKKYFNLFFHDGDIYLFGSRVDDSKKGGDIDLYFVLQEHANLFEKKIGEIRKTERTEAKRRSRYSNIEK